MVAMAVRRPTDEHRGYDQRPRHPDDAYDVVKYAIMGPLGD